jgi:hypothetical protein
MMLSARGRGQRARSPKRHDKWQTPAKLIETLGSLVLLPRGAVLEDPFYGDGASGRTMRRVFLGHRVLHRRTEFFTNPLTKPDYVVTCAPFSMTRDVVRRLREKGKPYALLVRTTLTSAAWFQADFAERPFQMLVLPGRPDGLPFSVAWLLVDMPCRVRNKSGCVVLKNF